MREVILQGELVELVGVPRLRMDVASPGEALWALCRQRPAVRHAIAEGQWAVYVDGRSIDLVELWVSSDQHQVYEIVPVLEVASDTKSGAAKVLFGILLIGSVLIGGPAGPLALLGAAGVPLGMLSIVAGLSVLLAPEPYVSPMEQESAEARQRFPFTGRSNLAGSGHAIPILYGRMRTGSVRASAEIRTTTDPLRITQFNSEGIFTGLEILSEGEIEGLVDGGRSIIVSGVRAVASDGASIFRQLTWNLRKGLEAGEASGTTVGVARSFPVNSVVEKAWTDPADKAAGSITRTIVDPDVDDVLMIVGHRGFVKVDAQDGYVNPDPVDFGIEINANGTGWVPAAAALGSAGFQFTTETVANAPAVLTHLGLPLNEARNQVRVTLATTATPPQSNRLRSRWQTVDGAGTPTGPWSEWIDIVLQKRPKNVMNEWALPGDELYEGFWIVGAISPESRIAMEVWAPEDYIVDGTETIRVDSFAYDSDGQVEGGQIDARYFDVQIRDLAGTYGPPPWEIRMYRETADTNDAQTRDQIYWQRYTEQIRGDFLHPGTAVIEVQVGDQQLFGQIPSMGYEIDGIKVEIPTGLDQTTTPRTYPDPWDGTWKATREWSDNPGWILWDILRNTRYGYGLDESLIDKWSLFECGRRCDELVDDGAGGLERRYSFNHVFTTREEALDQLQVIASAMHAQLWWANGKLYFSQDRPADPAHIFTNANVIEGRFRYEGTARSARTSLVTAGWRNPAEDYAQAMEPYRDPYLTERYGQVEQEVQVIGATSRGTARRHAVWLVETGKETQVLRFEAGLDQIRMQPGEIIQVQDNHRTQVRAGGRIRRASPTTRTSLDVDSWDASLPVPDGWFIDLIMEDGSLHQNSIVRHLGGGAMVLTDPIPGTHELVGHVWMAYEVAPAFFRVIQIREVSKARYEVMAIEHDPGKYARIEDWSYEGEAFRMLDNPDENRLAQPALVSATPIDNGDGTWRLEVVWTKTEGHWVEAFVDNFSNPTWQQYVAQTSYRDPLVVPMTNTADLAVSDSTWRVTLRVYTEDRSRSNDPAGAPTQFFTAGG